MVVFLFEDTHNAGSGLFCFRHRKKLRCLSIGCCAYEGQMIVPSEFRYTFNWGMRGYRRPAKLVWSRYLRVVATALP